MFSYLVTNLLTLYITYDEFSIRNQSYITNIIILRVKHLFIVYENCLFTNIYFII
jgi:hypothetical protein